VAAFCCAQLEPALSRRVAPERFSEKNLPIRKAHVLLHAGSQLPAASPDAFENFHQKVDLVIYPSPFAWVGM